MTNFIVNLINKVICNYKRVTLGKNVKFNGVILFLGKGTFDISDDVTINSGLTKNPIGGDSICRIVAEKSGQVNIGCGSGLSNVTIYSRKSVTIGRKCTIGGNVKIYDSDFHSIEPRFRNTLHDRDHTLTSPVNIGNEVFIGAHTLILKGVSIGEQSVIGAGSVVTKDVPSGQIWAGNPARYIKDI